MISSRPAQAMRGGAVLLMLAMIFRAPVIFHHFALAVAMTARPPAQSSTAPPAAITVATPPSLETAAILPSMPAASRVALISLRQPPKLRLVVEVIEPTVPMVTNRDPAASSSVPLPSTGERLPAAPADAFQLATDAYARLAAGDRRGAVRSFDAALSFDDPRSAAWRSARDALTRRWSGNAYSIVRASGSPGTAVTPILGGGQSGGSIAFTPDPLAARPFAMTLRGSLANGDGGRTAFAAAGIAWHPIPGVTLAAERLIGIGAGAPGEWTARIAAGSDRRVASLRLVAYAEGGIIGTAGYAAGQARIGPELRMGRVTFVPGVGGWGSLQQDHGHTVDRVDLGPGLAARGGPFTAAIDYRLRVAGNAAPGTGPVLMVSAGF